MKKITLTILSASFFITGAIYGQVTSIVAGTDITATNDAGAVTISNSRNQYDAGVIRYVWDNGAQQPFGSRIYKSHTSQGSRSGNGNSNDYFNNIGERTVDLTYADATGSNVGDRGGQARVISDGYGALGWGSFAAGERCRASGGGSIAVGILAHAGPLTGVGPFGLDGGNAGQTAFGWRTLATGNGSSAMGHGTTASGAWAFAAGNNTTASGNGAVAFGDGTTAEGFEVEHTYEKPGTYKVEMNCFEGNQGHLEGFTVIVESISKITHVPNIISPDGDHRNDFFFIGSEQMEKMSIIIRDNKGNSVFISDDIDFRWYATDMGGNNLPEGTYDWVLIAFGVDGTKFQKAGQITVTR